MFRNKEEKSEIQSPLMEEAAITLQKNIRGILARKKYSIPKLSTQAQKSYLTYIVGNDPVITCLDSYKELNDKIGLIGTSGLRSVEIACQLGNMNNIPKIILVDNSKEVCSFWSAIREFIKDDKLTEQSFFNNLPSFLNKHSNLYRNLNNDNTLDLNSKTTGATYPSQNAEKYLEYLIKKYGYQFVRAIISSASIINQSWDTPAVFVKIKNILELNGINKIYTYPSNIISCMASFILKASVLGSIKKINPILSIHTDLCNDHHLPEQVFVLSQADFKKTYKELVKKYFSDTCRLEIGQVKDHYESNSL